MSERGAGVYVEHYTEIGNLTEHLGPRVGPASTQARSDSTLRTPVTNQAIRISAARSALTSWPASGNEICYEGFLEPGMLTTTVFVTKIFAKRYNYVMLIGTSEAAKRLKISERRLRALLDDGRIPALRVSGRWVIDTDDLAQHGFPRLQGRPLSQRSAWQLAHFASGAVTQGAGNDDPSPIERHRLKLRLQRLHDSSHPLSLVSSLLARRAERFEHSAAQSDIAGLLHDPRLRLSGVSHAAAGLLSNSEVEAYVDCKDYKALVKDWLLVRVAPGRRPNVLLHVADNVPEDLPLMLVVADLADRSGVRERAAALELISRLEGINA